MFEDRFKQLSSLFYGYLRDAGMDAQVSYEFHTERKLHPERFKNQLVNQVNCYFMLWDIFEVIRA